MKALSILCLSIVEDSASASVLNLFRRQQRPDFFGAATAKLAGSDPFSKKILVAQYDSSAKRETLIWGPFKLNPANGTHAPGGGLLRLDSNSDMINTKLNGLCAGCMVLWAQADLSTKDGGKVDIGSGVYSHHILMAALGHSQVRQIVQPPACAPGKKPGSGFENLFGSITGGHGGGMSGMSGMSGRGHTSRKRQIPNMPKFSMFIGQGDEGSAMTFLDTTKSINSGFYLGTSKAESMILLAEAINYNKAPSEVYVKMEYEYIPNLPSAPKDSYDVSLGAINVSPCSDINLFPPNDKAIKYESPEWNVVNNGYIMDIKPHLHDGGVNVTFSVNGKVACSSAAVYGGETGTTAINGEKWETITAYEPCLKPVAVQKGDKVKMSAWYDLTKHKLRVKSGDHQESAEGMAIALFTNAQKRSD